MLPSGKSLKGEWGLMQSVSSAGIFTSSVSFALPLETAPIPHYIAKNGKEITISGSEVTSTECTGSASEPSATPGNLCVYASDEEDLAGEPLSLAVFSGKWASPVAIESWGDHESVSPNTASPYGFGTVIVAAEEGTVRAKGTWAVTAE
jgi:hypothetical protein